MPVVLHGLATIDDVHMSVHKKVKMPREIYHTGHAIIWEYIRGLSLYVQMVRFLYNSIVHTNVKGCTGKYAVAYTVLHTICSTHVQRMYSFIHSMYMYIQFYTQYVHVYTIYIHILTSCPNRFSWPTQRCRTRTEGYPSAL
jgi:hypothetical protein